MCPAAILSKKGNNIFGACENKVRGVILFAKVGEVTQMLKNYIIRNFILGSSCIFPFRADVSTAVSNADRVM